MQAVVEIIVDVFECDICGPVRVASHVGVTPDCDEDNEAEDAYGHVSRILLFGLAAQDFLPPVSVCSLEEALISAKVPAILEDIYLV